MLASLKFKDFLHPRPTPSGIDVDCKLKHFAIITYAVDVHKFAGLFPPRFQLDSVMIDGQEKGLLSVVPFMDVDFTSAVYPFPVFTMGQTNYRIYIIDTTTGERCVWFLGTTLDSWTIMVPRHVWKLPWHPGKISFNCDFDPHSGCYRRYEMHTQADWAPAQVQLSQQPDQEFHFQGFPDSETALVYLTHPLAGFYYRRNGKLGTYRVWHDRLDVRPAKLESAQFGLLSRMKLVNEDEQQHPYSVLLQPINEFTIYLPPTAL
ncbi:hypothetical protein SALWKB12_1361 [Snodgrassella communis]|uniref:DUF2071 domain-containing protein n=1 Tax=Snodgrassella alvi TaxID=1196083 RepID=A0A066TJQ3_9NEIS|nr:DUF2071 domain-containing protein [Snodgrassella communis]KDN12273.1 hypothetical protein SALWKB12_1361 [Snodgrassella communis]PIT48913.1 hypothetical protein BHC48_08505 [Snodgrassella communis]